MNDLASKSKLQFVIVSVSVIFLTLSALPRPTFGQSSTVFVLETSDLESPPDNESPLPVSTRRSLSEQDQAASTRIITDTSQVSSSSELSPEPLHYTSSGTSSPKANHKSTNNSHNNNNNHNIPNKHSTNLSQTQQSAINVNSSSNQQRDSKQTEPESAQYHQSATRSILSAAVNHNQHHNSEPPTPKLRTTRSPTSANEQYGSATSGQQQQTPPETEKRLLISISNNDQDDFSDSAEKPPKRETLSAGSPSALSVGSGRKPSITISIQDTNLRPNLDGQSGPGIGDPTLIVRPTDKGIEITTSNAGKPSLINVSNGNAGGSPYREPVNQPNPIRPTHRPTFNNNGINHNNNQHNLNPNDGEGKPRPAPISTLLDPPMSSRPPYISPMGSTIDERPQRPVVSLDDSLVEPQQPGHRPVVFVPSSARPHLEPPLSGSETGSLTPPHQQGHQPHPHQHQQDSHQSKYPLNEKNCGIMQETRIVGGEEANPDDFLWMAAIVKARPREGEAKPFCGGSLITRRHVLTAAHCLENTAPRDVLVRLGSYDFDDASASSTSGDYAVDQFRVPANYSKKTHAADIAIMRLKDPIALTDNYKTLCMPIPRRSYVGALGTVTGYGSQSQQVRQASPKLRQVTVPIWENRKCSLVYKRNLTDSFLCAGYEEGGKDACQGDSGGPLMTEGPNEKMMLVGVVSHGIGCGAPGYPGVYTRTTAFLDWIEKNTRE